MLNSNPLVYIKDMNILANTDGGELDFMFAMK